MATKKQRLVQPKTHPGPLLEQDLRVRVIFDHPEESPVSFGDVANVQVHGGVIVITFGRVAIPFDLTSQEIAQRALKQGMHATVVARVAVTPDAAMALVNALTEISKQMQLQIEKHRTVPAAQSVASIQPLESGKEQK